MKKLFSIKDEGLFGVEVENKVYSFFNKESNSHRLFQPQEPNTALLPYVTKYWGWIKPCWWEEHDSSRVVEKVITFYESRGHPWYILNKTVANGNGSS